MLFLYSTAYGVVRAFDSYESSDYHLKDDVIALEIKTYSSKNGYKKSIDTPISIYTKPISSKLLKYFHNASPDFSRKGDIRNPPDYKDYKTRALMPKKDNVVYRMNEISDVINALGEIDRPAEAYLVWWMHSKYSGRKDTKNWKNANRPLVQNRKYRKTSQGYEMVIEYSISRNYDKSDYESCDISQKFTDKVIVDKHGQIIYFKQLNKSKIKTKCYEQTCNGLPLPPTPTAVAPKKTDHYL